MEQGTTLMNLQQTLTNPKKCEKEENEPPSNKKWFVTIKNENGEDMRIRCFTRKEENNMLRGDQQ